AVGADASIAPEVRARAFYLAGNLEFLRGDYRAAVDAYNAALKLVPGLPGETSDRVGRDAAFNRAIALRRIQEEEEKKPPQDEQQKDQEQKQNEENEQDEERKDQEQKDQEQKQDSPEDQEQESPEDPNQGDDQKQDQPEPQSDADRPEDAPEQPQA